MIEVETLAGYQAVRENGAGIIDITTRGRIRVEGTEAIMFLNGLITNDMKTLALHRWMPAAFPNVQGRLIAAIRVARLSDRDEKSPRFLLDTEEATHAAVLKTIERFTLAGDFKVNDVTTTTAMISIQGRKSAEIIQQLCDATTEQYGVVETTFAGKDLLVLRSTHTAEDGFDLIVDSENYDSLAKALIAAGAVSVSPETFETLRIEAGIGRFGKDMDETNVITEANLDDAVSFTKGCYIGQEIIARIKYRGHVAKKLTGLTFDKSGPVTVGETIKNDEGKDIGRITSESFSPTLNRPIALGYVRYEQLAAGTEVVVGEGELKASVTQLPFVRGSWYENEAE
ncbi:MAG TPA: aminomethyltransferase family protein [Pyrinomonadaceae bacterium]